MCWMEWKDVRKKLKVKILLNIKYRAKFLSKNQAYYCKCHNKSNWLLVYYIGDDILAKKVINYSINVNFIKVYSDKVYKKLEGVSRFIFVNAFLCKGEYKEIYCLRNIRYACGY